MRKATKRMEEEPVEATTDPSPPKKSKIREKKVPTVAISTRLPRAAKTKAYSAQLNNNVETSPVETVKKSRSRAKPAMQKSNSSDDIASKTSEPLKKSKSAEDIDQQGAPAPKKGRNVAAKKPVGKKAAMEGKPKPKGKATKEIEPEEQEDESEDEQPRLIAKKGYSGAAPTKKVAASKKNTRGRGKPASIENDEEETEDAVEEVKIVKGKKGKINGKKAAPVEDPEEEIEGDKEDVEDVAEEIPEDEEETTKPKKGKKGGAPMKKGRGKKAAPNMEPDEIESEENGKDHDENSEEHVEETKKETKPVKGRKGKAPAAKNRGKKAAPKAKEDDDEKEKEAADDEEEVKEHSENGDEPLNEEEIVGDKVEPAANGKDDLISEKNRTR